MLAIDANHEHRTENSHTAHVDVPASTALSARRLNVMRVGYAFLAVGLACVKWPILLQHARTLPAMASVEVCMLTAMSLLMLLGVRYPARLLPILLFEAAWKLLWFAAVGLPRAVAHDVTPRIGSVIVNCSLVVVVLAVIPWRHVWNHYVKARGESWR